MVFYKDPIGLYSLLLLVPFLLLYFFSLRPRKKEFSSIMFFVKNNKTSKTYSFFRRLITNLLLLLQLLVILFLAYSSASPQIEYSQNSTDDHIVLVIDTSASMQAKIGMSSRFEKCISDAKNLIKDKSKVSIILAEQIPLVVLEKGSSEDAGLVLDSLEASESTSNVPDAMVQAMTLIDEGTVYVYSDYAYSQSLVAAKKQMNVKGINVVFKEYNSPVSNVGFIDYSIYGDKIRIKIKNFNSKPYKIKVECSYDSKVLTIPEKGVEEVSFDLKPGEVVFKLVANDDFSPDNFLYISIPKIKKIKTLFITNGAGKDYSKTALKALDRLDIETTFLPVIPEKDYELYIIKDIDSSKLLPSTFDDLYRRTKKGSSLILNLQEDSLNIDYKNLGLMKLNDVGNRTPLIKNINNLVTSEVQFGEVDKYFMSSSYDCDKWVMSKDENPVICYKKIGNGHILINGILNGHSEFKNTPDYPIFWSGVLDFLFPEDHKEEVNLKSGKLMVSKYQKVITPKGDLKTNKILMNYAGFYNFDNKTYSANLIDYDESNINLKQDVEGELGSLSNKAHSQSAYTDLAMYLIFIALILLMLELFMIKWRGDL